jgi:thioredoxin 1
MKKIIEITDENFKTEVLESDKVVLVDFWAPWCAPCRMVGPIIEQVAESMDGKMKFGKLNTDLNQKTAMDFKIMAIPTLLIFKGGKEVDRIVGFKPKDQLEDQLNSLFSNN